MCECIKSDRITAGWGCCECRAYNGLQREVCGACGVVRRKPLSPDRDTGEHFETYEEAYANDPVMLEAINRNLRSAQAAGG